MRSKLLEIALGTILLTSAASAGTVSLTHASFRMISPDVPGAAYFDLRNLEDRPVILTGARSASCGAMMFHLSSTEGGMARMREADPLVLQPGEAISFKPGGYHIMCMDPSAALMTARTVTVRLEFKNHPPIETAFTVTDAFGHPH